MSVNPEFLHAFILINTTKNNTFHILNRFTLAVNGITYKYIFII